jgi:hypothetical protein
MDLLERYLSAIESQLPEAGRADIMAELRDALLSEREAREAPLGRGLTRDETAELLRSFGHPLVVAGRYRRFNRLIGPEAFPFYWFALRVALTVLMIVTVVAAGFGIAAHGQVGRAIGEAIERLIGGGAAVIGWTTLVFALIEYYGVTPRLAAWNPRQLPPAASPKPRKGRFDAAVEIAMGVVFIAFWTGTLGWAWVERGGASQHLLVGGPARETMHLPVLALAVAGIAVNLLELVRPGWHRLTCGANLAWALAAVGVLIAYVGQGPLLVPAEPAAAQAQRLAGVANIGLGWLLAGATAVVLWEAARDAWWLVRNTGAAGLGQPRRNGA